MGAKNKSGKETKWQCLINLIALLEHECRRKQGGFHYMMDVHGVQEFFK